MFFFTQRDPAVPIFLRPHLGVRRGQLLELVPAGLAAVPARAAAAGRGSVSGAPGRRTRVPWGGP